MGGTHYCFVNKISKMAQVGQSESDDIFFLESSEWKESQEIMTAGIIFAFLIPMEKLIKVPKELTHGPFAKNHS